MKASNLIYLCFLTLFCYDVAIASPVKEKRNLQPFDKINVSSGIDVYFTQGKETVVEVEAENEMLNMVITTVERGILMIKKDKGFKGKGKEKEKKKVTIYITASSLSEMILSGGSDFYIGDLAVDNLSIKPSGGSDVEIGNLKVVSLDIHASGGSDCDIDKLEAKNCNFSFSGGSDLKIDKLKADIATINASGGSDIALKGEVEKIDIDASGGSDIDIEELRYKTINSNIKKR